jgi:prophage regulatory protein
MSDNPYQSGYLLRIKDVEAVVGLCRSTIFRRVRAGDFPKPLLLGRRHIAWEPADIAEWRRSRARQSYGGGQ